MKLKRPALIILATLFLLLIFGLIFRLLTQTTPPPPAPIRPSITFHNLIPQHSTLEQFNQTLGQPVSTTSLDNQTTLHYYRSDYESNHHVVTFVNNAAALIQQKLSPSEELYLPNITPRLQTPTPTTLYASRLGEFYPIYVYPPDGIALVVHEHTGRIAEIWYFTPSSDTNLLLSISPDPLFNYAESPY